MPSVSEKPSALEQDVRILSRMVWVAALCGDAVASRNYATRLNALLLRASGFEPDDDETPCALTDPGQQTLIGGLVAAA